MKRTLFVYILCFILVFVGCGEHGYTDTPKQPTAKEVLDEILTEEEQRQIIEHIYDIKFKPHIFDIQCYTQSQEAHSKLYEISLKELPILVYTTCFFDENRETLNGIMTYPNFCFGIIAMLHANEVEFYYSRAVSNTDIDWKTYYREWFFAFFKNAEEECSKVIASDNTIDDKIETLANYGILAIPYVKEEIDKGNLEYEVFFTEIGLHMTTENFATVGCYFNNSELYINHKYSEIRDNYPAAEDFDYKVWLSENEEDLDNLFKFLDAYCAEYEAEKE